MTDDTLDRLLAEFSGTTAGVRHAVVVSPDGLKLATSPKLNLDLADQLSAVTSGLVSLARGAAALLGSGPMTQTILELEHGYLFVTAIGRGAALAVHAERSCDIGAVGYAMTMLAATVGNTLDPQVGATAGDRPC